MKAGQAPADGSRSAARTVIASWDGCLAMGFGAGLAPVAPGSLGTLVAVPPALLLDRLPWLPHIMALAVLFALGVWLCKRVGERLGRADHSSIVWDEMVGYWLTVSALPAHWPWLLAGFILFRLFDIVKPWPIRAVEARLKGGLGVMLDDVLAAGYAVVLLTLVRRIFISP